MSGLSGKDVETRLSQDTGIPTSDVSKLLSSIAKLAFEEAHRGFLLPGLGEFVVARGPGTPLVNPFTGEKAELPGPLEVQFRVDSTAEEAFHRAFKAKDDIDEDDSGSPPFALPEVRLSPEQSDLERAGLNVEVASKARNKLGGEPDWIQEPPERIVCCAEEMTFYGQFDSAIGGIFNIADSGMLYVYLCLQCFQAKGLVQYY